jgi:hypothetical protein
MLSYLGADDIVTIHWFVSAAFRTISSRWEANRGGKTFILNQTKNPATTFLARNTGSVKVSAHQVAFCNTLRRKNIFETLVMFLSFKLKEASRSSTISNRLHL